MANQYTSELTEQRAIAVRILSSGQATVAEIAAHFDLGRSTVQRWAAGIDVATVRAARIAEIIQDITKQKARRP